MLRYTTNRARPGLVALYDIWPGNGAGPFLQPRSPHGAVHQQDNSTSGRHILMRFFGGVRCVTSKNWLDSVGEPARSRYVRATAALWEVCTLWVLFLSVVFTV